MTEPIQLTVFGPRRECATQYGYGDYYLICDDLAECDFVLVDRGSPRPVRQIRNAITRVKRTLRRKHDRDFTYLPFPGFARVKFEK